ncbi:MULTISPECIES: crotonase/enoyl-CoA hydratase family protein [unclassified Rhodococcus (in: high G+C Gram-positive bacteria)]|uniref:crotonase/enoyl-CoA hydratase family protein n=1 Tax=unclassified Rhodococcus (in: high G+C Gram-positive bacteria) TaxID=192944 RepID=UPI0006FC600E|nr:MULTISPECIES: crotonase/enoyl-CoA hydratase family protein [unclassified Rhodococcus (in: high G+C Gram-positive bacteria)]KQU28449.1 enoyl-CoA hydratase [Rhodococcus sp. Leaf225]KQU47672.1 enoyl-CoA hydratase [Rhodococcus sp. Leaf258]
MNFTTLGWEVEDGVLTLTLDRPDHLNAFDLTMANELVRAFERVRVDNMVRAVVVTGAGRAFCAGMDLSTAGNVFGLDEEANPTPQALRNHLTEAPFQDGVRDAGGKVTLAIHACDKPVIAAINGAAVGVGATMTLAMDVRLVSTEARFGLIFGRLGIVPEAASSYFLPRIVGISKALELVYAADILSGDELVKNGLARSVHEPLDLVSDAVALAHKFIDGRSNVALALSRRLLYAGAGSTDPLQAHRRDSLAMWHTSRGDGKEGVAAFLEKRAPVFTRTAADIPELDE